MSSKEKTPLAAGPGRGVGEHRSADSIGARPIPVKSHNGRVVGHVEGDALVKNVDARRHQLKRPQAWAMDTCILEQAEEHGVERVVLKDDHAEMTWEAWLTDFYGRRSIFLDRGFGKQRALLLDAWNMRGEGVPEQLTLFGRAA